MDDEIISNVQSMQLKDGTIIVVNQGEQAQKDVLEVEDPNQKDVIVVEEQNQSNQLRARPMVGRLGPVLAPPIPMVRPVVAPLRPPLKPMVVPRGPIRKGYPVYPAPVFRGRGNPYLTPKPVIPPNPKVYPRGPHVPGIVTPAIGKPRMMVTPPVVRPGMIPSVAKPGMIVPQPVAKPLLNQIIQAPHVMPRTTAFRARPGQTDENDFQEEEYNGEEYCECDNQAQDENAEVELRARPPFGVPVYRPVPVVPKVLPRPVVPMAPLLPKRGPIPRMPLSGYNTFQPRVFRARPRGVIVPTPMFTPLNATFQPKSYGFGRPLSHHPGKRGYIPPPPMRVFRARPRSNSYDGQEYDNQNYQNEFNTEGNECGSSVCTRCGKEF